MPIYRGQKDSENPYFQFNRSTAQDERLSAEALGVITYLISKPDDWKIMNEDIQRRFNIGRDKCSNILKELEKLGYLVSVQPRSAKGKFEPNDRWIYDTLQPSTENPYTEKPITVKPTLHNKEVTKERNNNADKPALHFFVIREQLAKRDKSANDKMIGKLAHIFKEHDVPVDDIPQYFQWLDANKRGLVIDGNMWSWSARNMSAYVTDWLDSRLPKNKPDRLPIL